MIRLHSEEFEFEGPAGRLQGLVDMPQSGAPAAAAIICHPHPLHGGTLQNKVVHTVARAFTAQGFLALRFNFRGVGRSAGEFDDGRGELQDALAAHREAQARAPGAPVWFAGFSFGAAIAIRAAVESNADGLISIAPAVSRVEASAMAEPSCPWLIIQGDEDELVPIADTIEWVNRLQPGPELQVFDSTEHFFHGKLVALRKAIERFVGEHGPDG
jgi:uncharacterized protein